VHERGRGEGGSKEAPVKERSLQTLEGEARLYKRETTIRTTVPHERELQDEPTRNNRQTVTQKKKSVRVAEKKKNPKKGAARKARWLRRHRELSGKRSHRGTSKYKAIRKQGTDTGGTKVFCEKQTAQQKQQPLI